jgi:hypothetical protein
MNRITFEEALKFKKRGYMIYPDPTDPRVAENHAKGIGQVFERLGKLPFWDEDFLVGGSRNSETSERSGYVSKSAL